MAIQTFISVGGSPSLTETVTVTINVRDSNDARPLFIGSPYTVEVEENTPVNTSILSVQALDMDKVEDINKLNFYHVFLSKCNGIVIVHENRR